ncbi:MAG: type IV pilus modification protein PilV [Variovorax sp.]
MKTLTPRTASNQGGLALLEVLISLLIFSLGILGLIGLQTRAVSLSVDAEDRNRAALLANEVASTMWLQGSVTLSAEKETAWKASVADPTKGGLPNGVGTVTAVTGTTKSADIKITWHPPSRSSDADDSNFTTRVVLP